MADDVAIVPSLPVQTCDQCRAAEIVWALTSSGKRMPLDAVPTQNGNVCLTWDPAARTWRATVETVWERQSPAWAQVPRHVHHGTTCPESRRWWRHAPKSDGGKTEAKVSTPDRPGEPSGRAPALHPGSARPEQGAMF